MSQVPSRLPFVLLAYGIAKEGHGISAGYISGGKRREEHSHCQMDVGEDLGRVLTARLIAGGSDVLRRPETRTGLNSGLTQLARRDQTGKNAMPLSPKPQVAGSIPVPPAPF